MNYKPLIIRDLVYSINLKRWWGSITPISTNYIGMTASKDRQWFALRVTYSRELKFQALLQEAGFQTFVPMCARTFEKNGKKGKKLVPAVSNLCFVKAEKTAIDSFIRNMGESCPARFMWDNSAGRPMVVPTKAMEDFIKVSLIMSDDALYLKDISEKLREGQKVRVIEGPFKGVEGVVVRIKRSRRIVVELPGMLAIATTFVDPRDLELI